MPEFTLRYVTGIATLLTVFSVLWALSQGALRRKAERALVAEARAAAAAEAERDEVTAKLYVARETIVRLRQKGEK